MENPYSPPTSTPEAPEAPESNADDRIPIAVGMALGAGIGLCKVIASQAPLGIIFKDCLVGAFWGVAFTVIRGWYQRLMR